MNWEGKKNYISYTFNKERQMGGKDWLYSFLKTHPELSLRNLEKPHWLKQEDLTRGLFVIF